MYERTDDVNAYKQHTLSVYLVFFIYKYLCMSNIYKHFYQMTKISVWVSRYLCYSCLFSAIVLLLLLFFFSSILFVRACLSPSFDENQRFYISTLTFLCVYYICTFTIVDFIYIHLVRCIWSPFVRLLSQIRSHIAHILYVLYFIDNKLLCCSYSLYAIHMIF